MPTARPRRLFAFRCLTTGIENTARFVRDV